MMPFMTGNITTTVMQDVQDPNGNPVVVQVFNDGIPNGRDELGI